MNFGMIKIYITPFLTHIIYMDVRTVCRFVNYNFGYVAKNINLAEYPSLCMNPLAFRFIICSLFKPLLLGNPTFVIFNTFY
jgi:hypothetical protein